jgi:gamma-glutamyltranspeptidase
MSDGIGGDLLAIVYGARTGKLYGLNASGWAPSGLTSHRSRSPRAAPIALFYGHRGDTGL